MDVNGQRPSRDRAVEQRAGGVLDVDLEAAQPAADSEDPTGEAEQPLDVIELVDLGQHHAAAEIASGRVRLAVVLVRMPARQVLPLFDMDGDRPAQRAVGQ